MEGDSSESVSEGKFASQQELKLKEFLDGELKYVEDLEKIVAILEDMNSGDTSSRCEKQADFFPGNAALTGAGRRWRSYGDRA